MMSVNKLPLHVLTLKLRENTEIATKKVGVWETTLKTGCIIGTKQKK